MSSTSSSPTTLPSRSGRPDISWPLERPTDPSESGGARVEAELRRRAAAVQADEPAVPYKDLLPGHRRSQSGIASRSFLLGQALGACLILTWYGLYIAESPLWRPPFFLATLALFHFLEFWTHARYNLPNANTKSFLLFSNGWMYQAAHGTAMLETVIVSLFFPRWQASLSYRAVQWTGLGLILIGQVARSVAMATAGRNFNHIVQHERARGHELVEHGIYHYLRHPSYFGFFWWAIGTQLALGNFFSLCLYIGVLWGFFNARIRAEENHLIQFFGDKYVAFRSKTIVGIPFIR